MATQKEQRKKRKRKRDERRLAAVRCDDPC